MEISIQKSNHLKAVAGLMMLCLHLFNRPYKGLFEPLVFIGNQPLSYYISLFCDACVPIFCFVSGYGLYFKFQKNSVSYRKENNVRIKKLYINYWIVLILFAVLLGLFLNKKDLPGSLTTFFLNFSALENSYNGAWWFFFTYILLVASSVFIFRIIDKVSTALLLSACLMIYIFAFYFRVYRPDLFSSELLNWFQRQITLFGTSLLPFSIGGLALKEKWNSKISAFCGTKPYRNTFALFCIFLLMVVHGLIPNFFIAPFLAVPFLFVFVQMKLPTWISAILDYISTHATNMWLVHMFFYMVYFEQFIYSPRYVLPIFLLLVCCSIISSIVINKINIVVLKTVKLQ